MLIVPVADYIKLGPAASHMRLFGFEIAPILMAVIFFANAIQAKRELPRH